MQLSIFDPTIMNGIVNTSAASLENKGKLHLYKWRLFEWLEKMEGKDFLLNYEDNNFQISVPFSLGAMDFGYLMNRKGNPAIQLFDNGRNVLRLAVGAKMESCEVEDNKIQFFYEKFAYKENKKAVENGVASNIIWKEYKDYIKPSKKKGKFPLLKDMNQDEITSILIGRPVSMMVRFCDELFSDLTTSSFVISSLKINEDKITLVGTNNVSIKTSGFKKIRVMEDYLLFDIYTKESGYSQTFYMYL